MPIIDDPEYEVLITGNIAGNGQFIEFESGNRNLLVASIEGIWAGTIVFEATLDGISWVSVPTLILSTLLKTNNATANGTFVLSMAGFAKARLRASAWASGTANLKGFGSDVTPVVYALQADSWNLQNITGTVSLPTGAATESTLSAFNNKFNQDFGVSTGAIRVASLLGNASGSADFNSGNSSSQTLRVVVATNQTAFPVNQGLANTLANAWPTKITDGTDSVRVTANSDLSVSDGLGSGGKYGNLSLTTGGTAYEAKVGASRLANRKSLTVTALDDMYWGYDNLVTPSTGTPLFKNQQIVFSIDPDSTFQVWLVSSTNSKNARITESV